ncbi:hypothetical protein V8C86DRAFT_2772856 [Haematococcus lacustris]|nr:uncharacterized protein HaLaN_19922 [Haematococcus lacustris]
MQDWQPSSRDYELAAGLFGVGAARYFYIKNRLRPFQFSVLLAVPCLGTALMETIVNHYTPITNAQLEKMDGYKERVSHAREQNEALLARLKLLAEQSKKA